MRIPVAGASRVALIATWLAALSMTPLHAQVVELVKLAARDGTPASRFGRSLAMESDRIVVGAPGDEQASDAGAVYVFERQPHAGWIEVSKLTASDPQPYAHFGRSVALSGDRLLIGAGAFLGDPLLGNAYVFERSANGAWMQVAALEANDSALGFGQGFGMAVAVKGDRALIGAQWDKPYVTGGAAYVFDRHANGAWLQTAKLSPPSVPGVGLAGNSVVLDGDQVLLGAPWDDEPAGCLHVGSVVAFELESHAGWVETEEFHSSGEPCGGSFGSALSLDKDRLLVGSPGENGVGGFGTFDSGAAYIFERESSGMWRQAAKLIAPDASAADRFGGGAIHRDWALVRAAKFNQSNESSDSNDPGKAYLFHRRANGEWLLAAEIGSSAATKSEGFGDTVALWENRAVIGAATGEGVLPETGVAYVFEFGPATGAGAAEDIPESR